VWSEICSITMVDVCGEDCSFCLSVIWFYSKTCNVIRHFAWNTSLSRTFFWVIFPARMRNLTYVHILFWIPLCPRLAGFAKYWWQLSLYFSANLILLLSTSVFFIGFLLSIF
jgi:hypothetical protein